MDSTVAYSFGRRAAIAVRLMKFDNRNDRMSFYATQLNVLAQRWNGDAHQANVYFSGAVGPMSFNGHEHSAILTAIDADIESRWLFSSVKAEKMWTGIGSDFWHLQSRFGAAPYAAGFKQFATWFMVQYEYNPLLLGWSRVTPLARFYYQNYLFEGGVSLQGEWMFNFMVHI